ncbi:MAG: S8 family serine peptidase [Chitinophagales bacterium]
MSYFRLLNRLVVCLLLTLCVLELSAQKVEEIYCEGKIFLKLKSTSQVELPAINSKSDVNAYPYFKDLLQKFKAYKLFRPYKNLKSSTFQNLYQIEFEEDKQIEAFIRDLKKQDMVDYVEPIPMDYVLAEPNDQYEGQQWYLSKMQVFEAWDITSGSNDVVVAIVDDAIKVTHEDLKDNIWVNEGEIPDNGIDDDGNGYIDDYKGWDAADNDNNPSPPIGSPYLRHGTHVTGIAAARTNNNLGVASIGNGIKILPIKATEDAQATSAQITHGWEGISYAISMGVDVINLSWGSKASSETYQNMINEAHNQGIIIVAAAGNNNDSKKIYPAAYNHVLAVASTDFADKKLTSSTYGDWIDVSAPGGTIISTGSISNDAYEINSGTSMSAPMVTGLLGLMKSYDKTIAADDIVACLLANTDPILDSQFATSMGTGRINAYETLNCLLSVNCSVPESPSTDQLSPTTALLSWRNEGSSSYKIAYKLETASNWIYTNATASVFYLQNLQPNKTYVVKVASFCGDNLSDYSPASSFTTKSIQCMPPTGINLKVISSKQVRVGWSLEDNKYVESYKLRYKKKASNTWKSLTTVEIPVFIDNLEEEQSYELQVACNCFGKQSEYSATVGFFTKSAYQINTEDKPTIAGEKEEIEQIEAYVPGLQAFPNPSNGQLFVEYLEEKATQVNLNVYDLLGRLVSSQNLPVEEGLNRFELDLSTQPKGRYIVELAGTNQPLKQSIIIY